jgi:hypothetical protein
MDATKTTHLPVKEEWPNNNQLANLSAPPETLSEEQLQDRSRLLHDMATYQHVLAALLSRPDLFSRARILEAGTKEAGTHPSQNQEAEEKADELWHELAAIRQFAYMAAVGCNPVDYPG